MLCININAMKITGICFILFLKILNVRCVHVKGTWKTEDFFLFLVKFGFQKTDLHNPYSSGYIYGNMTTDANLKSNKTATFVVLDNENFNDYYHHRLYKDKSKVCQLMFTKLLVGKCAHGDNKVNFITEVPCKKDKMCANPGSPDDFIHGSQFSYQVKDYQQPK